MRRPWSGAMPMMLTLPLRLEHHRRARRRKARNRALVALLALGLALLAARFFMPAKAEIAEPLLGRLWHGTTAESAQPSAGLLE